MGDIGDMGGARSKPPDCAHQERARESCTGSRAVVSSPVCGGTEKPALPLLAPKEGNARPLEDGRRAAARPANLDAARSASASVSGEIRRT